MSDFITPIQQQPTPCDFGPFAGGYCGKIVTIDFNQVTSSIAIADLEIELFETSSATINIEDLIVSSALIDYTKTVFNGVTGGTITFDAITKELLFTPDQTPSVDRIVNFTFEVEDQYGFKATGNIKINIVDKTPVLTTTNVSLSGTEGEVYTIDTKTKTTIVNTTVNYANANAVVISVSPTEGNATVSNGIITYTPSQASALNRTVSFKYKVTDLTGLTSESTISIALTDITPALSTTNASKSLLDSATLTGSILSNMTIKNDTFKTLSFGAISEGTITVSGSNYTFTPSTTIKANRVVTVPFTITSTTGLTSTSTLTLNITYDNQWDKTFWYGNSTVTNMTVRSDIEALSSIKKTGYAGTYTIGAGTGTYKWFVYPKAWGTTPTMVDASNNMPIATNEPLDYITIEGIELVAIRSYYTLNGSISIKFS